MNTTKTSTNSTQGATAMRTNTNHVLHVAVHDITEMVDAYYATTYTEALTKYQRAGVVKFIVGTIEIVVTTDADRHGLWVSTFRKGVTVEHTFFAWPTNPTAVTTEQVAGHVLTLARDERNHHTRVDFYRQVTKQKPYVVAVRYASAPDRRAQYIQSERRRRVNLTSRVDVARGFATEQEAQAWIDGIAPILGGLLMNVANRREWAVAALSKLGAR